MLKSFTWCKNEIAIANYKYFEDGTSRSHNLAIIGKECKRAENLKSIFKVQVVACFLNFHLPIPKVNSPI